MSVPARFGYTVLLWMRMIVWPCVDISVPSNSIPEWRQLSKSYLMQPSYHKAALHCSQCWSYIETCPRDAKIHLLSVEGATDSLITEFSWKYVLFKLQASAEYSSALKATYAFALNCPPHLQDSLLGLHTITSPIAKVSKLLDHCKPTLKLDLDFLTFPGNIYALILGID